MCVYIIIYTVPKTGGIASISIGGKYLIETTTGTGFCVSHNRLAETRRVK